MELTRKHDSHERDRRRRPRGHPSWISETNSVPVGAKQVAKTQPFQKSPLTTTLGQVGPAFTVVQIAFEDLSNRGTKKFKNDKYLAV